MPFRTFGRQEKPPNAPPILPLFSTRPSARSSLRSASVEEWSGNLLYDSAVKLLALGGLTVCICLDLPICFPLLEQAPPSAPQLISEAIQFELATDSASTVRITQYLPSTSLDRQPTSVKQSTEYPTISSFVPSFSSVYCCCLSLFSARPPTLTQLVLKLLISRTRVLTRATYFAGSLNRYGFEWLHSMRC